MSALFKLGIVSCLLAGKHIVCKCSIVPTAMSKEFKVCDNDAHVPSIPFGEGWLWMEVGMPMVLGLEDDMGQGGKHIHHALPIMSHMSCPSHHGIPGCHIPCTPSLRLTHHNPH